MKRLVWPVFAMLLLLCGCFNVREPEPPTSAGGWTSPTETGILLENLRLAFETRNAVNYERCFAPEGYRFIPEPLTPGVASGVFDNWSVQEERIYLTNIKSYSGTSSGNNVTINNKQELFFTADSLELTAQYALAVQHQDTSFRHYHFNGSLRMIMVRRQNEWCIQSWRDNRQTDSLCWTDLKKHFFAP